MRVPLNVMLFLWENNLYAGVKGLIVDERSVRCIKKAFDQRKKRGGRVGEIGRGREEEERDWRRREGEKCDWGRREGEKCDWRRREGEKCDWGREERGRRRGLNKSRNVAVCMKENELGKMNESEGSEMLDVL